MSRPRRSVCAESRKVLELIEQLRAEGNAVILITHNMEHVVELADRAVVLRQGRKVGELKPDRSQPTGAGLHDRRRGCLKRFAASSER